MQHIVFVKQWAWHWKLLHKSADVCNNESLKWIKSCAPKIQISQCISKCYNQLTLILCIQASTCLVLRPRRKFSCWNTFVNLGERWSISRYFEWWECVIFVEEFVCLPASLSVSYCFHRISVLKKLIFFTASVPNVRVNKAFRWICFLTRHLILVRCVWPIAYVSSDAETMYQLQQISFMPISLSFCRINTQFIINILLIAARHKIWITK